MAIDAPLGYSFFAGMAALFNPCGMPMLPAYIGYQLGQGESKPPFVALLRGTLLGVVATLGFVVVFGSIGALIASGERAVIDAMPYAGLGVGIAIVLVALWLLTTRRNLGLLIGSRIQWDRGRGIIGTFLFGMAYGVCSLSCALPIFLVAVVSTTTLNGLVSGIASFVSYAMGMGVMLLVVTWGVVVSREGVRMTVRRLMPLFGPVGNLVLLGAGSYVVYYWTLGTGGKQFIFD
ncbi:MAG: hypothetical protein EXR48_02870 [Dehalococcoidia bacterium]|nr:hypothetical protein [Dehalococcoidia bacterium]